MDQDSPGRHRIVLGKDTRLSGYMVENALSSGILSMGVDVLFIGPLPTPGVAYVTRSLRADAGINKREGVGVSEAPRGTLLHHYQVDDIGVVQKVHERILELLTQGEELRYIAVQKKPVINVFPMCIVLTTRRFIIYKPELMGQAQFEDYISCLGPADTII